MKNPIFIVGEGRSGTTLLRRIIAEHPNIWAVEKESYIFVDSWAQSNLFFDKYKDDFEKLLLTVLTSMKRVRPKAEKILKNGEIPEDIQADLEEFKQSVNYQELRSSNVLDKKIIFDSISRYFAQKKGASRVVEKTPFHLHCTKQILDFYPDAQIIAIYRDPRAVNSSWIKKDKFKSILGTCNSWNRAMKQIKKLQETLPKDKFKCIKFEDLISNPSMCLADLMAWLGEDFSDDLLKDQRANTSFESEKGQTGFLSTTVDRWKSLLNKNQIILVNLLTKAHHDHFKLEEYSPNMNLFESSLFPAFYAAEMMKLAYGKLGKFFRKVL